jgi:hypothetical protein
MLLVLILQVDSPGVAGCAAMVAGMMLVPG